MTQNKHKSSEFDIFKQPLFITFEGGEGSGKSTQSKLLYEFLLSQNIDAIHTREVGGTEEAEKIRDLLVFSDVHPMTQLLLVMAARYEHINKVILPALNEGKWVICDRFVDSSACYQAGESGLTIDEVYEMHSKIMHISYENDAENLAHRDVDINIYDRNEQGIMPNLTFFMDIMPDIALKRALSRGDANNFDRKSIQFHQKIYDRFQIVVKNFPDRIKRIYSNDQSIENIHADILRHILDHGTL